MPLPPLVKSVGLLASRSARWSQSAGSVCIEFCSVMLHCYDKGLETGCARS